MSETKPTGTAAVRKTAAVHIAIALLVSGCSSTGSTSGGPSGTALVQFADNTDQTTADGLRNQVKAQLVTVFPTTKVQVWRMDAARLADVAALRNDPHVRFVETTPGAAPAAIPAATVNLNDLPPSEQPRVQGMIQGVEAGDFRITASRPVAMNEDFLNMRNQNQICVPLPAGRLPVFLRESVEKQEEGGELVWTGNAVDGNGEAMLIARPEGIAGRVRLGNDLYLIFPVGEGRQLIRRVPWVGPQSDVRHADKSLV